jgi:hypothetical protein
VSNVGAHDMFCLTRGSLTRAGKPLDALGLNSVRGGKGRFLFFTSGEVGESKRGRMVVGNRPTGRTQGVLALQPGGNCHGVDTPGLAA